MDLSVADDSQLVIVGDTHGQLEDVLWIFFKYGWPSEQNRYLFNCGSFRGSTGELRVAVVLRLVGKDFQTPHLWPKLHPELYIF